MDPLETLGFALAGYGCTTCIGNSGPLDEPVARAVEDHDLVVAAVLSRQPQLRGPDPSARPGQLPRLAAARRRVRAGRPGRHRPDQRAARASATTAGRSSWPTSGRRRTRSGRSSATSIVAGAVPGDLRDGLRRRRSLAGAADPGRRPLRLGPGSTYVARPPFFDGMPAEPAPVARHRRRPGPGRPRRLGHDRPHLARPGSIAAWSPAGQWLQAHGVGPLEFNSYGARRGQHEVMMRGHVRQHPPAQPRWPRARRARTRSTCPTARRRSSTTPRCATRRRARRCS